MEAKRFVSSNRNVALMTRQTCGQRSSMSAGGKRRAIAFEFSIRISYMFLISKCRRESDLGLCTTLQLANKMPLRSGYFWLKNVFRPQTCQDLPMRCGILFASTEVVHKPSSDSPLYFDIRNIWQIRKSKSNASATTNSMKCLVNWTPMRIRVRSKNRNTPLHLQSDIWAYIHIHASWV